MEIEFKNVTYIINNNTSYKKTILDDVNVNIKENSITCILGSSKNEITYIKELINMNDYPTKGYVKIGNYINNGQRIKNINKLKMNIGIVHSIPSQVLFNKTVKQELEFGLKYFKYKYRKRNIRVKDALKLVNLPEDYLNKEISNLSFSEQKKLSLACILVFNPKIIVLDEITIGLNHKEKTDIIRLIKLMKNKYNKTIIILTKDTDFAYELDCNYLIINNASVVKKGNSEILINEKFLNYCGLEVPKIIKFINSSNEKKANLTYTNNILDLIKEVYRNVR